MRIQRNTSRTTRFLAVAALTSISASALAQPYMQPPPPPPISAPPPVTMAPPAPTEEVAVPDYYVWDGNEYVGVIGDRYYYLAPGNVWLPMPSERWEHFRHWQHEHQEWREHMIRNERYRRDARGQEYPWKEYQHEQHEYQEHHEHEHD